MARKKDVSSVVSGAGFLTRIFTDLDKAIRAQGGTDEDWHRLTTPEGERTIQAMADALMEGRRTVQSSETYHLTVDRDRLLSEMIKAGRYDDANDNITAEHFPVTGSGTVEYEAVLVHLDRWATTREVETEIQKIGFKSSRSEDTLAFGEQYPDVQREFPIVALGSSWVSPDGRRNVVCLWGSADERYLNLNWDDPDDQWHPHCRFLAVRKKQPSDA